MKEINLFEGMSASDVSRYREDDTTENNYERVFSKERLGSYMTAEEIEDFFRETELKGEKGWKVISTNCKYIGEHENYMCPYNYYLISARFKRVD